MFKTAGLRLTSFWQFQAAGWVCFCLLSVLVVIPYVRQPGELGYQSPAGLFADQGLMCLACILASLVLRPLCHSLVQRSLSWIAMEIRAAGWSLAVGTSTALLMSRLTLVKPEPVELWEACAKTSVLLFLWCNLYFSVKQSQMYSKERKALRRDETIALSQNNRECISRFSVRTGQRIQVVPSEDVGWISAAGDYVELHTRSATHLLRDSMNSLGQKLDPAKFIRIHRSKIINLDCVLELRSIENREFIVKLCDGSQHRSSRTYASQLERWLHSGQHE